MLLAGVEGGTGGIGGICRVQVDYCQGVGEGSPYAILRYICHREASGVRQMDSDILDNGYRPMGGKELVARGEGTGERVV